VTCDFPSSVEVGLMKCMAEKVHVHHVGSEQYPVGNGILI